MGMPIIPVFAAVAIAALAVYKYVIHPAMISPLARIPNAHWSSSISPLYVLFHRQQQNDTTMLHDAHARLGPVVRLAPNEISINSVEGGIRSIYAGGFEKGKWYSNVFSNYGVEPMFAMEGHQKHSKRKRMLSNIYAKSTLQASEALTQQTHILLNDRLYSQLIDDACSDGPIELYDVFSAVTMDFVSAYIFGLKNSSDHIRKKEAGIKLFHDFKARQKYTFWPQEMPGFTKFMDLLGFKSLLVPKWVDRANTEIEEWISGLCDAAENTLRAVERGNKVAKEDYPTVYAQLRNALLKEAAKSTETEAKTPVEQQVDDLRLEIASELLDHTLAGFDTSGITLTWLAYELSRPHNLDWQDKLRAEIAAAGKSLDAKTVDGLSILHAVLMETLRLHAAIPGNQPRVTPSIPVSLGDTEAGIVFTRIPPGTRVQSQAWSLHRNPSVFPEPDVWNPARWLTSDINANKEMTRWFWAFGSGGRMCVGSNLAMLDMKATIVALWGSFSTELVDGQGMMPNGGYMAEPLGIGPGGKKGIGRGRKFCVCRLTELSKTAAC